MTAGRALIADFTWPARLARALGASDQKPPRARLLEADGSALLETRILAEQVRLLSTGAVAALFNFFNAVVVAALLWSNFPRQVLAGWVGLTLLVIVARLLLLVSYKKNPDALSSPAWARAFTVGATASGLLWGALAVLSAVFGDLTEQVFVAFVIAGVTAGALGTLTPYLLAYFAYLGGATLPLAVGFLHYDDPVHLSMGVLTLLYFVVMVVTARSYGRYIGDTIRLGMRNRDLNHELEVARRSAELAARGKWEALAHLSHELRTPMNAVLGFSDTLRSEVFGPLGHPRYLEYSRHVHESGRHVLDLITEILTLAEAETDNLRLTLEPVDIATVARRCLAMTAADARTKAIRLVDRLPDEIPLLVVDRLKVSQLLLNLLSNAIKYTPSGGEVAIAAHTRDGQIAISISDNGIGMTPEDVPKALQPFVRLASPLTHKTEGTGLGLPLCQRFAELHGGRLDIESAAGIGTTVIVTLPRRTATAQSDAGIAA